MWMTSALAAWRSNRRKKTEEQERPKIEISKRGKAESVNSVVLPADLPLEEIAKEVVRLKTEAEKDTEDRRNELLAEAMQRSDRKWVMLFCFLTALSIGMLTIVAMRIGPL